jgi:ferredoxin
MLVINPDECIDCGVCIPECPEEAIFQTNDKNNPWYKHNEYFGKIWPNITKQKSPMPEYEKYSNSTEDKTKLFKANKFTGVN